MNSLHLITITLSILFTSCYGFQDATYFPNTTVKANKIEHLKTVSVKNKTTRFCFFGGTGKIKMLKDTRNLLLLKADLKPNETLVNYTFDKTFRNYFFINQTVYHLSADKVRTSNQHSPRNTFASVNFNKKREYKSLKKKLNSKAQAKLETESLKNKRFDHFRLGRLIKINSHNISVIGKIIKQYPYGIEIEIIESQRTLFKKTFYSFKKLKKVAYEFDPILNQ